jgi:hypothetical protein
MCLGESLRDGSRLPPGIRPVFYNWGAWKKLSRHPGESRDPEPPGHRLWLWMPAGAGMTYELRQLPSPNPSRREGNKDVLSPRNILKLRAIKKGPRFLWGLYSELRLIRTSSYNEPHPTNRLRSAGDPHCGGTSCRWRERSAHPAGRHSWLPRRFRGLQLPHPA